MGCSQSTEGAAPQSVERYPLEQHRQQQQQLQQQPMAYPPPQAHGQQPHPALTMVQVQVQQQHATAALPHATAAPPHHQPVQWVPEFRADTSVNDKIPVKPVELDRSILERYVALEKQIHSYEGKNVQKNLQMKTQDLKDYEAQVKDLQAKHAEAMKKTAKEKADVDQMQEPSVKAFFQDQSQYDAKFTKEQEEYLEAVNEQEIITKELEAVMKQHGQAKQEVDVLTTEMQELDKLYTEQDELLASIFNGDYGSDLEDRLEAQLDALLDRKQRISVAKYKWTNSRVLLQYACNQLAFACKRWQELVNIPVNNMQGRYGYATEVRNNLVASNQNITSAQRYLSTIQFPYCRPDEMTTLMKATNNIYMDMQSNDRHHHALQCYNVTYKRAAALLQWFDMVINQTIVRDMDGALQASNQKEKELRAERLRCIKEKIREVKGESTDLEIENEMDMGEDKEVVMATMAVITDDTPETQDNVTSEAAADAPEQLPEEELAPAPDQLFGNIDELKKQHEKEIAEFDKAQGLNKARMEQGLEEKLQARRSRRKRQEMQS